MKKKIEMNARSLCLLIGCLLVVAALIWGGIWYGSAVLYASRCQTYMETLRAAMPPVQNAVLPDRGSRLGLFPAHVSVGYVRAAGISLRHSRCEQYA